MISLKRCALGIGLAIVGCVAAQAMPPLTTIQDILYNADGTRFEGVATISWAAFEASDGSNISAQSLTTHIVDGLLLVQLVPTTNALTPSSYSVLYSSGNNQYTETWAVPPSNVPLPVSNVRISAPGTVIGGGGNGGGVGNSTVINISDVTGLATALSIRPVSGTAFTISRTAIIDAAGALEGATGNATDCMHVDGTSGPCSGGSSGATGFIDGEVPVGTIDGVNSAFTFANAPSPASSLSVYLNGLLMSQGLDYSVSGNSIVFAAGQIPQPGDTLMASYRMNVVITGVTFVDGETPSGVINGSNLNFSLSQAPNPASSLTLYLNGMRLAPILDYSLSGTSLSFSAAQIPQPGDVILASYRVSSITLN